jgi:RNA polymerase sigma-70 factor (ECF subfamily)
MTEQIMARNAQVEAAYRNYADMVYKVALSQTKNKTDAEDVFQNVFLSLVRNKKEILTEEHMKAWLIRVTVNYCKKLFSSAYRRHTTELTGEVMGGAIITPEERGVLEEVLALPPKYRLAIHLFTTRICPLKLSPPPLARNRQP